jgi:hypothetical protein
MKVFMNPTPHPDGHGLPNTTAGWNQTAAPRDCFDADRPMSSTPRVRPGEYPSRTRRASAFCADVLAGRYEPRHIHHEHDPVARRTEPLSGVGLALFWRPMNASLIIRTIGGMELPLVCSPSLVAPLLGRSDHAIRDDCVAGVIPTLPRAGGSGAHHRIATARLLDQMGVPYEIVTSG